MRFRLLAMKRFLLAATLSLALSACAGGQRGPRYNMALKPVANPSQVIAAELAFARLAQDRGQWAAFRATAADEAEMFVPQRTKAADWLKGRGEPAVAVKWQPHAVWSSCDGSAAVTRGSWHSPNGAGHFATVWRRQKDGGYKWVADMSLSTERTDPAPEMVQASVADCPKQPETPDVGGIVAGTSGADIQSGTSADNTLAWTTTVMPDGTRQISVRLWKDGTWRPVLAETSLPDR